MFIKTIVFYYILTFLLPVQHRLLQIHLQLQLKNI